MGGEVGYREADAGPSPAAGEGRVFGWLTRLENLVMAIFLLAALGIGTAQVVLRYVFNTGFVWSEGAVVVLTIWGALFGASQAVTRGLHVRVEVFADSLPHPWRRVADFLANLVSAVYVGVLCYCGVLYVRFLAKINAVSIDLEIPEWLVYLIVPVSMGLFLARYLHELWLVWRGGADARPRTVAYD